MIQIWKILFQVVFGVPDTGAGAHHLHVSGFGSAFIAETVLVRHRAFANVGDDFHVRVRVRRKARVGRDLVVVPDAQRAPTHSRGIDMRRRNGAWPSASRDLLPQVR
jgi:hypothetical protein